VAEPLRPSRRRPHRLGRPAAGQRAKIAAVTLLLLRSTVSG
jgi:hypothetical protein